MRSVRLTAAVIAAARARESDVWAAVGAHLSPEEQLLEWPFVRSQLRALAQAAKVTTRRKRMRGCART